MNFLCEKSQPLNQISQRYLYSEMYHKFKTTNDPSFIISISGQFEDILCQRVDLQHQSTREIEVGDQKNLSELFKKFNKNEDYYLVKTKNNNEEETTIKYLFDNLPPNLELDISQAGPLEELVSASGESSN